MRLTNFRQRRQRSRHLEQGDLARRRCGRKVVHVRLHLAVNLLFRLVEHQGHGAPDGRLAHDLTGATHVALERFAHLVGALVPVVDVLHERLGDDVVERGVDVRADRARPRDGLIEHGIQHVHAVALEELATHDELPQGHAHREQIAAAVGLAPHLLGGHVADLALEDARLGSCRVDGRLGDTEIDNFYLARVRQKNVVRRDVAMDDPERRPVVIRELVRVVQAAQCIGNDPGPHDRRDHLAALRRAEHFVERLAFEILHRDEVRALVLAHLIGVHDVRMREPRRKPRLIEEHREHGRLVRHQRAHALQHDELVELHRPAQEGQVDLGHSSAAELGEKLILAESQRPRGKPLIVVFRSPAHTKSVTARIGRVNAARRDSHRVRACRQLAPVSHFARKSGSNGLPWQFEQVWGAPSFRFKLAMKFSFIQVATPSS